MEALPRTLKWHPDYARAVRGQKAGKLAHQVATLAWWLYEGIEATLLDNTIHEIPRLLRLDALAADRGMEELVNAQREEAERLRRPAA